MYKAAFNKIEQTQHLFNKIVDPLEQYLGISFGYMLVFKDGSYYKIGKDKKCLYEFVSNVYKSYIFCDRNVTNHFDKEYFFTLWPKIPTCRVMEIYLNNNLWNGITVSKFNNNSTELFYFTGCTTNHGWNKFFIRNKALLINFINIFEKYKKLLFIPESNEDKALFKFSQGFDSTLPKSEYIQGEASLIKKTLSILNRESLSLDSNLSLETKLAPREIEVLSIICRGYTVKIAASMLNISPKTAQHYIERVKQKTGLHFRSDLVAFYEKQYTKR